MDLHELSEQFRVISDKLDIIRRLSRSEIPDFRNAPYDNDFDLLNHLLDDYISTEQEQQRKRG